MARTRPPPEPLVLHGWETHLGQDVPFTTYTWGSGQNCAQQTHTAVSSAGRGHLRPVRDIVHHHYARRRGLTVPYITAMAEQLRPGGGGGDYGSTSGGYDQLGFGILMYAKQPLRPPNGRQRAGTTGIPRRDVVL